MNGIEAQEAEEGKTAPPTEHFDRRDDSRKARNRALCCSSERCGTLKYEKYLLRENISLKKGE